MRALQCVIVHGSPNQPSSHPSCFTTPPPPCECFDRLDLGLFEPPLPPLVLEPGQEQEWIELRPRWPLTDEKHSGSMPATRSSKAASKQARSLTDETREALQRRREGGGSGGCGGGGNGDHGEGAASREQRQEAEAPAAAAAAG